MQALVELDENVNRVLNVVKAKYNLKDKSQAINLVVREYVDYEGEPDLKPEFIERIKSIAKQKSIRVDDFAKRYRTMKAGTNRTSPSKQNI